MRVRTAFFLSGCSAIVYQLVWQRVLFGVYGSHAESVTVVVAAFMGGLGFGSLAGGWVADRTRWSPVVLFAAIELAIGVLGWVSVDVFRAVGAATVALPDAFVWLIVGALLVAPTSLMGATLPILTAGVTRGHVRVGQAAGGLYGVNTLGAAIGAIATVAFVAGAFGQRGSAHAAALLNGLAALTLLVGGRR